MNKRGDSKVESNDSPEIPDRGETSDIPGLPSGESAGHFQTNSEIGVFYYDFLCLLNKAIYMKVSSYRIRL